MKRIFSIFLLFIMTANVAVSLAEQLRGGECYEVKKGGTDDADEKEKSEKEKGEKEKDEKERKSDTIINHSSLGMDAFNGNALSGSLNLKNDYLISEYHGLLPELPPKA